MPPVSEPGQGDRHPAQLSGCGYHRILSWAVPRAKDRKEQGACSDTWFYQVMRWDHRPPPGVSDFARYGFRDLWRDREAGYWEMLLWHPVRCGRQCLSACCSYRPKSSKPIIRKQEQL